MNYTESTSKILYDDGFLVREAVNVTVRLKRCPFCGAKPKTQHANGENNEDLIYIECPECEGASGEFMTHEEAARAWNRRER